MKGKRNEVRRDRYIGGRWRKKTVRTYCRGLVMHLYLFNRFNKYSRRMVYRSDTPLCDSLRPFSSTHCRTGRRVIDSSSAVPIASTRHAYVRLCQSNVIK